ncbi:MAG: hypothetical protein PVJ26_21465 [Anaerolineae bacterium]|jgi:hypothetical protein
MKKSLFAFVMVLALLTIPAGMALAAPGGMPGAHGIDGKTFGDAVSSAAQSEPGAIADHVSNAGGNGNGMPAAHGVDGQTFGSLVSGLAQSGPGAVAGHVSGK